MAKKKNESKQTVVPELRFSAFRGDGEWQLVPLGKHADIIKERAGKKKYPVMSVETGVGLVSQLEKFGRDISGNSYKNYTVIQKDDFAYNKSATKEFPEGFVAKHGGDNKAAVPNSIFTCFRVTSGEIQSEYLYFQLLNNLHGKWLRKFITVGARAHGALSVNSDDLMSLPVPVPSGASSVAEQQKIADCLGSLDDLIAAHCAKLEALKDRKKGLLQQLFPAAGQSTPALRFPEFEDAGEWDETTLGKACLMKAGKFVNAAEISDLPEGNLYPCFGGNGLRGYTTTYTHEGRYTLIGRQGALCGNVQLAIGRFHATEHAVVADPAKNVSSDWLFFALILLNLNRFATGQAQPGLSVEVLERIPITIPSRSEQQKIADCLSALDTLIAAQVEYLNALKEHKKGLMQQLFPNLEISKA